jgi:lambda repressor-like predicted transcriptional regulator
MRSPSPSPQPLVRMVLRARGEAVADAVARCPLSRRTWFNVLAGNYAPNPATRALIAQTLGVQADVIFPDCAHRPCTGSWEG